MKNTFRSFLLHKKQNIIKIVIIIIVLFCVIYVCYTLIGNIRKDRIKGGAYYGVNLGMDKEEVKKLLQIRAYGQDKISFDNEIYSFQNFHFFDNKNYYVDEAFMFDNNILDSIFINIKCIDTSLTEKMKEDTIKKLVDMYGDYEIIDQKKCWIKDNSSIYMLDIHPTQQIITLVIENP